MIFIIVILEADQVRKYYYLDRGFFILYKVFHF